MALCKRNPTPMVTHWSYVSFALKPWYIEFYLLIMRISQIFMLLTTLHFFRPFKCWFQRYKGINLSHHCACGWPSHIKIHGHEQAQCRLQSWTCFHQNDFVQWFKIKFCVTDQSVKWPETTIVTFFSTRRVNTSHITMTKVTVNERPPRATSSALYPEYHRGQGTISSQTAAHSNWLHPWTLIHKLTYKICY